MSKKINKNRNKKEYVSGINVARALRSCKDELKCNEDTIKRTEIHGIIVSALKQGKSNNDIISELSKNERYSKYTTYFEKWIEHTSKKITSKEERQK